MGSEYSQACRKNGKDIYQHEQPLPGAGGHQRADAAGDAGAGGGSHMMIASPVSQESHAIGNLEALQAFCQRAFLPEPGERLLFGEGPEHTACS